MTRLLVLSVVLVAGGVAAGQEAKKDDPPRKPQWQRMLTGDDAKRAEELMRKLQQPWPADKRDDARKLAEELLALRIRVQGADHWEVSYVRYDMQDARMTLTVEQRQALKKANELGARVFDLWQQGKSWEAVPLALEEVAIQTRILGAKHPRTGLSVFNLGAQYDALGDFSKAESLYRDALRIRRETFGEWHPDTASTLNNLAHLLQAQGRYAEAEPLIRDALRIHRDALGERHADTALNLNSLAFLYHAQGRYTEAEPLYHDALRICRETQGERHADTALILNNLAGLYDLQGRNAEAEVLLGDALRIRREVLEKQHPHMASSLNNLANLYRRQRRFAEAEQLFREVQRIHKNLDERHPRVAAVLNSLAVLYSDQGKHAEAESHFRDALRIARETLGERHPETALYLYNLARHYHDQGKHAEAGPLYREALRIRREILGERHPETAETLNNLVKLLLGQGKHAEAEPLHVEWVHSYEASRLRHARTVERSVGTDDQNPYPSLAVASARTGKPAEAYRALESDLARGLLDEQAARRGAALTPDEERDRAALAARLAELDARVLRLVTLPKRSEAERKELETLTAERRDKEDALARLAASLSRRAVAGLGEVEAALGPDAALLAWVHVKTDDGSQEHWACVVRSSRPPRWERLPGTGAGGKWSKADGDLPLKLRDALAGGGTAAEVADLARKLHAQRIAPVLKHLDGVKNLHVAAVGPMAGVPVEVLAPDYTVSYVPSGTFLARRGKPLDKPATLLALGDPTFPRPKEAKAATALPPGGLLITQVVPGGGAARAFLWAGDVLVAYAGTKLESVDQLGKLIADSSAAKEVAVQFWREAEDKVATRQVASGRLGVVLSPEPAREAIAARRKSDALLARLTRGGDWAELPGTAVEVAELARLFGPDRVTALTGSAASERALDGLRQKKELSKFRYLHLATHGEANTARAFDSRLVLAQDGPRESLAQPGEPLLDNQLTAAEVLEHWKLEADLVTLSACATALGKAGGGDGLLGFAQAFLLAGSRSVCLSLWDVDDTATALLMDRFYRNLLGRREDGAKPLGKAAALREAKEWLKALTAEEATRRLGTITEGVSRGSKTGREVLGTVPDARDGARPYAHPRYWAAFILVGEPD